MFKNTQFTTLNDMFKNKNFTSMTDFCKNPQFVAMNAQCTKMMETYVTLANVALDSCKQVAFIQCESVRKFMDNSSATMKNILSMTNPTEMNQQVKSFTATSVESSIANTQEIIDVMTSSKAAFNDTTASTIKDAQESLVKSVDQMPNVSPAFSKAASESLQNIITTSNQAADSMSKVSAQVSELATKNFESATQATLKTVKKATAETIKETPVTK